MPKVRLCMIDQSKRLERREEVPMELNGEGATLIDALKIVVNGPGFSEIIVKRDMEIKIDQDKQGRVTIFCTMGKYDGIESLMDLIKELVEK